MRAAPSGAPLYDRRSWPGRWHGRPTAAVAFTRDTGTRSFLPPAATARRWRVTCSTTLRAALPGFGVPSRTHRPAHIRATRTASDMNYLIVAPDRIPWGHLNEIDMGAGGYRVVSPDLKSLECDEIGVNDDVEFDGRGIYRKGRVLGQREYLPPVTKIPSTSRASSSPTYRPQLATPVASSLVRGIPSGIASRRFVTCSASLRSAPVSPSSICLSATPRTAGSRRHARGEWRTRPDSNRRSPA